MSVVVEMKEDFGVIRMDHVANRNALSPHVLTGLQEALATLENEPDVRVILLTGTDPAFSAGADIRYMCSASPEECRHYLEHAQQVLQSFESTRLPVVAVVNGACTGGGCTLAGSCDLAIAADCATFGEPEARIGLPGGFGNVFRLIRRVGRAAAADLMLTGRIIDADTALRIGLVSRVVPAATLWDEAEQLARQVADNSPTALGEIKHLLRLSRMDSAGETDAYLRCLETGEAREGMRAFLEKRRPRW